MPPWWSCGRRCRVGEPARPRLTLVDKVLAAEGDPKASPAVRDAEQKVLSKYAPSLIKEGRQLERAEWRNATGATSPEQATEIYHLRAELKNRPTVAELGHAKHASRGFSMLIGTLIGLSVGVVIATASLTFFAPILNNVVHESTLTGAAVQQLNPPRACTPGEHLPDGRVCPTSQTGANP